MSTQFSSPSGSWSWCAVSASTPGLISCVEGERALIWWISAILIVCFSFVSWVLGYLGLEAPYGRYNNAEAKASNTGVLRHLAKVDVPAKLAWFIQECPTVVFALGCLLTAEKRCLEHYGNCLAILCFLVHYSNRTFVFPLRLKGGKPTPIFVMMSAFLFCFLNGYIQMRSLTRFILLELDATVFAGFAIWLSGMLLNLHSDHILRNLRAPGETSYKIPRGGLFEYVSCANYTSETLEWIGYAIMVRGSMPAVTFAIATLCNLGPRALIHHEWYKAKFEDYPKSRAAFIPFWPQR